MFILTIKRYRLCQKLVLNISHEDLKHVNELNFYNSAIKKYAPKRRMKHKINNNFSDSLNNISCYFIELLIDLKSLFKSLRIDSYASLKFLFSLICCKISSEI